MYSLILSRIITYSLFILLGIVIIISIISIIFKSFRDKLNDKIYTPLNKRGLKEVIFMITFIFTMASIFFAITTYYEGRQIQLENEKIILDNLMEEIKHNLYVISYFEKQKDNYLETDEFTPLKFEYYYLEKSADIVKDKHTREIIIKTINDIKGSRIIMDEFSGIYIPITDSQLQLYRKLKREWTNTLIDWNKDIKPNLEEIRDNLILS